MLPNIFKQTPSPTLPNRPAPPPKRGADGRRVRNEANEAPPRLASGAQSGSSGPKKTRNYQARSMWLWRLAALATAVNLLLLAGVNLAENLAQAELSAPAESAVLAEGGPLDVVAFAAESPTPHISPSPTATPTVSPSPAPQPSPTPSPSPTPLLLVEPDTAALESLMLDLLNADRVAQGLTPVALDAIAGEAGRLHVEEMAALSYLNHWNEAGYGPDYRYSQAGGLNSVRENLGVYQHTPGIGPRSQAEWAEAVQDLQQSLLASPSHRENMLTAAHTHVGLAVAYNAETGTLAVAQEFVRRYVALDPLPLAVQVGETITITGRLLGGGGEPLLNVAYQPFPEPVSLDFLRDKQPFRSPAEIYAAQSVPLTEDGQSFSLPVTLDYEGRAGLYHLRLWVDTIFGETLAADVIVSVGE